MRRGEARQGVRGKTRQGKAIQERDKPSKANNTYNNASNARAKFPGASDTSISMTLGKIYCEVERTQQFSQKLGFTTHLSETAGIAILAADSKPQPGSHLSDSRAEVRKTDIFQKFEPRFYLMFSLLLKLILPLKEALPYNLKLG